MSWEYRLFGVWGYRVGYPLADISALEAYKPLVIERLAGDAHGRTVALHTRWAKQVEGKMGHGDTLLHQ